MKIERPSSRRLPHVQPARSVRTRIASLASILFALACCVNGQLTREPQAKSPEEFDDFLEVLHQQAPTDIVSSAKRFAQRWPESALLGQIYGLELDAYRQMGDSASAIAAGESALKRAPDNLEVLAEVAYLLADSKPDTAGLARADSLARRVLELVDTIRIPRSVSPQQWAILRAKLETRAHIALGLVAFNRGQPKVALEEMEIAIRLTPEPEAGLYYRLGLLYRVVGDEAKGVEMLRRAASSTDATVRNLAEQQLRKARAEPTKPKN